MNYLLLLIGFFTCVVFFCAAGQILLSFNLGRSWLIRKLGLAPTAAKKATLEQIFPADVLVREIMTPRKDIVTVRENANLEQVRDVISSHKLSRVLVTGDNLDDIKGLLLAKDLVEFLGRTGSKFSVRALIRPIVFVPGTRKIDELFGEFKSRGVHLAVVVDEHGGVDGLVTLEDLLEEIVGEIFDEHDNPALEREVRETKTGDLIAGGHVAIHRLAEDFGVSLPAGEYDTVAGFVLHSLGRFPIVGDTVQTESHKVEVLETLSNRIVRLKITANQADTEIDDSGQAA